MCWWASGDVLDLAGCDELAGGAHLVEDAAGVDGVPGDDRVDEVCLDQPPVLLQRLRERIAAPSGLQPTPAVPERGGEAEQLVLARSRRCYWNSEGVTRRCVERASELIGDPSVCPVIAERVRHDSLAAQNGELFAPPPDHTSARQRGQQA
jgi:hypothetical protein